MSSSIFGWGLVLIILVLTLSIGIGIVFPSTAYPHMQGTINYAHSFSSGYGIGYGETEYVGVVFTNGFVYNYTFSCDYYTVGMNVVAMNQSSLTKGEPSWLSNGVDVYPLINVPYSC
jgi:hypothetical protein